MKLTAKTLFGLEKILSLELSSLGAVNIQAVNRAVMFEGDRYMLYKANYCLRTALSVLFQIAVFRIRSADDLYRRCLKIDWSSYLDSKTSFAVVPVVNSPLFNHTGFAGLRLKDAVADWFRAKTGNRPSVDTNNPDILINLHISNDLVTVSLDSSVIPLYKRGYRKEQGAAPMNEILAAGIVMNSGWDAQIPLIDPMCGSGTIPVEAALFASNIPPGRFRKSFGFQLWRDYDQELFKRMKEETESHIRPCMGMIFGSDISEEAVEKSRANIGSAGLSEMITLSVNDLRDLKSRSEAGVIIMNPPYGQRIRTDDSNDFYGMIGTVLKHGFPGYDAWIISSDKESLKHVGLKPSGKTILFNGALECLLVNYKLYQGSKKAG
ncbi:MAG: class I SAM-dependent RNA methyltransferase [Bacteroidales bacterium]|nr:class I SAM-dependent RNA methyltransferase [Bacteroidales bacterium]